MIKKIALNIIRLYHGIIDYSVCTKIKYYWRVIYSYWIQLEFGKVGRNVYIGKMSFLKGARYITLADNVSISERFVIEVYDSYQKQHFTPILTIGTNSHIGDDGHITCINQVQIGNNVLMGRKVFITDNAHGASDRNLLDSAPNKHPLISKGAVIIEDNVEIGANTTVDKSQMGSTIIRKGAKIDNLCQIAHNVEIGENTVMAAQTGIAGSTKIGRHCVIGGQVGIAGHLSIADNTTLAAQTGVISSVKTEGQVLFGSPALPHKQFLRAYAIFRRNGKE